ncbi:hypothetical protein [Croceicoccus sp. YJ47]|uniref:hypothetical protein n=1 Tax=Croceicoccus sp. YJ47 TaxID=2798724 RepID=UPI0019220679|nr:hypothetical protein [Croceicoccus sp. YJ47]QQN74894.1 hypothetical protein JD971_04080 [Croceicoccus sp. YJ47]
MKQFALVSLRVATALLLVVWGLIRVTAPEKGAGVSAKYYSGLGSAKVIQVVWGAALLIIGMLVIIGLFRRFALVAQAVVLVFGALTIWKYLLDPLGLYLLTPETSNVLFFPSLALAFASLLLVAMRDEDRWSLDCLLEARRAGK